MSALKKLNGVFAVYKTIGITSAKLTQKIRSTLLNELSVPYEGDGREWLKVGHGGTLDLEAEGVLAVGIGEGCKHLPTFLHGDKKYRCTAKLGQETTTLNASGAVTNEMPFDHVTKPLLDEALKKFVGKKLQVPPSYSALKLEGRRYSDYAYEGRSVADPAPRAVWLYTANCQQFNPPLFTLDVECGGGFYVRSLVQDLGRALRTCGHLVELQRTKHGEFTTEMTLREQEITVENVLAAMSKSRTRLNRRRPAPNKR